jgi:signal transduction histidine kinase/ActR/RegA family two-component response regulator
MRNESLVYAGRGVDELRVLVLPPTHADGLAIAKLLTSANIATAVYQGTDALRQALRASAGCVILSEEAVLNNPDELLASLAGQPMWSDTPVIVLSRSGRESSALDGIVSQLGSVSVVERPMRMSTLLSLVRSSLRARERQYQVRDFLQERERLLDSERSARNEAERAGRTKDEFLATLSHELRTPLNAVLGWARVLRNNPALTDEVANGLTVIERNARSQAQIIGDLLDMSRIISGKVRLEVRPVELGAVIEATVETVRPTAEARDIQLVVEKDADSCQVHADPDRLQQVLWNLLSNALKFTPKGGRVHVRLSRTGAMASVDITDDGEGIAPDVLPHIFDRFHQADASTARRHGGLGLGLSIVRQLTELHGGTVAARSDGPGCGATFRLQLPVLGSIKRASGRQDVQTEPQVPVAMTGDLPQVNLRGLRVLVVDDEPDARALIQRLLQDCQARVLTAASAEEALGVLAVEVPDVVVSDVGMPGIDGYTLLRRIRSMDDAASTVPAIALTAYVRTEDRAKAIDAGFQFHLSKPVEPAELLAMVERLAHADREAPAAGRAIAKG